MAEGRLHGILNGCEYPEVHAAKTGIGELISLLKSENARWAARRSDLSFADFIAFQRLEKLEDARSKPAFIATSVSRVVDQKMLLFKAAGTDGVAGRLDMLTDQAASAGRAADEVLASADALTRLSTTLQDALDRFLVHLQAGHAA